LKILEKSLNLNLANFDITKILQGTYSILQNCSVQNCKKLAILDVLVVDDFKEISVRQKDIDIRNTEIKVQLCVADGKL